MTDTSITTSQTGNDVSLFDTVITWIEQGQTIWGALAFLAFIMVFGFCLINFRKKVNRISGNQIDAFVKVKKYIPSLYVELNDNMEQLRYFIFSYRWKWRIIRKYNLIFKGYVGKQLKQGYKKEICYRISYLSKFSKVKETIIQTNKTLNEFRNDRETRREALGDFYFVIQNLSFDCINAMEQLLSYCDKIEGKNMIVVGSAGNGKTSLLCRATEMAIKNRYPCLMVNSRDVENNNVIEYILEKLPLIWKVKNHPLWFLRIVNFALFFKRKYLFIIIDAINENDETDFLKSIGKVNDYFKKYSRVKILLSCRSEYFDCRYQKVFEESQNHPYIFKLTTTDYNQRAVYKFFIKYSNHYKFPLSFSENVHNKISKSLLLMRMFFEVNSNRAHENLEFQNAEIYKQYVKNLAAEHPGIDVNHIITLISAIMIDEEFYDKIEISKLNLSDSDRDSLYGLLDNNLLINKTIKLGHGISERSVEYLYFIFDEFRDFCIARELLIRDEKNNDSQYSCFFSSVTKMMSNKQSPLEGILKYGYYHFKKAGRIDLIDNILKSHGGSNIQQINRFSRYDREKTYYFDDFGLTLIFMDGETLLQPEKDYLYNSVKTQIRSNLQVFFFLVNNELAREKPNLSKYLDIVLNETDSVIISSLVDGLVEQERNYRDSSRLFDLLYEKIDRTFERNKQISSNIRKSLVLLFSLAEDERHYLPSGEPIELFDSELDFIISAIKCSEIKAAVEILKNEIKKKRERNLHDVPTLHDFLEFTDKYHRKK